MPAPPSTAVKAANNAAIAKANSSSPNAAAQAASRNLAQREAAARAGAAAARQSSAPNAAGAAAGERMRSGQLGTNAPSRVGNQIGGGTTQKESLADRLAKTAPTQSAPGKGGLEGPSLTRSISEAITRMATTPFGQAAAPTQKITDRMPGMGGVPSGLAGLQAMTDPARRTLTGIVAGDMKPIYGSMTPDAQFAQTPMAKENYAKDFPAIKMTDRIAPTTTPSGSPATRTAAAGYQDYNPLTSIRAPQAPAPRQVVNIPGMRPATQVAANLPVPERVYTPADVPELPRNTVITQNGQVPMSIFGQQPAAPTKPQTAALQTAQGQPYNMALPPTGPEPRYVPISGPETMPDPPEPGTPQPATAPGKWSIGQPGTGLAAQMLDRIRQVMNPAPITQQPSAPATQPQVPGTGIAGADTVSIPSVIQAPLDYGKKKLASGASAAGNLIETLRRATGGEPTTPYNVGTAPDNNVKDQSNYQAEKSNHSNQQTGTTSAMTDAEKQQYTSLSKSDRSVLDGYIKSGLSFAQAWAKLKGTTSTPGTGTPAQWTQPQFGQTPTANMQPPPPEVVTQITPLMQAIKSHLYG